MKRSDFPVPRSLLPRIQVTPQERAARKAQMERMLHNALDEYDRFRTLDHSRIDLTRWKLSATKDALRLYRERKAGSTGEDKSHGTNGWEDLTVDPTKFNDRQKVKSMLMFGEMPGRAEDAIYAVLAESNTELAFVHTFLHDDAADSHLLDLMEGPTPEKPLHSLGYKWFVKRAPGGGRIIKHRDVLSLEYTGMTTSRTGEKIGYLLIESVDIPGFPDMKDRNCLRAVQSVCALVRQKRDGLVEVYMTGVVELSGKFIRPISSMLTAKTMFIVTKVMDLAMCKRLTKILVRFRPVRRDRLYCAQNKPAACEICLQKPGFFKRVHLSNCGICGLTICSKCLTPKRVYFPDLDLGHYERIDCCTPCVFSTSRMRAVTSDRAPIKIHRPSHPPSSYHDFESDTTRSSSASRPRSSSVELSSYPQLRLPPSIEEETSLPVQTGITLLPKRVDDEDQSQLDPWVAPPPVDRKRTGSLGSRAFNRDVPILESSFVVRSAPSEVTFSVSAPGGTYNLAAPPPAIRRTPSDGTTQQELYRRMIELRLLAECSYNTMQENRRMMQQRQPIELE